MAENFNPDTATEQELDAYIANHPSANNTAQPQQQTQQNPIVSALQKIGLDVSPDGSGAVQSGGHDYLLPKGFLENHPVVKTIVGTMGTLGNQAMAAIGGAQQAVASLNPISDQNISKLLGRTPSSVNQPIEQMKQYPNWAQAGNIGVQALAIPATEGASAGMLSDIGSLSPTIAKYAGPVLRGAMGGTVYGAAQPDATPQSVATSTAVGGIAGPLAEGALKGSGWALKQMPSLFLGPLRKLSNWTSENIQPALTTDGLVNNVKNFLSDTNTKIGSMLNNSDATFDISSVLSPKQDPTLSNYKINIPANQKAQIQLESTLSRLKDLSSDLGNKGFTDDSKAMMQAYNTASANKGKIPVSLANDVKRIYYDYGQNFFSGEAPDQINRSTQLSAKGAATIGSNIAKGIVAEVGGEDGQAIANLNKNYGNGKQVLSKLNDASNRSLLQKIKDRPYGIIPSIYALSHGVHDPSALAQIVGLGLGTQAATNAAFSPVTGVAAGALGNQLSQAGDSSLLQTLSGLGANQYEKVR